MLLILFILLIYLFTSCLHMHNVGLLFNVYTVYTGDTLQCLAACQ